MCRMRDLRVTAASPRQSVCRWPNQASGEEWGNMNKFHFYYRLQVGIGMFQ